METPVQGAKSEHTAVEALTSLLGLAATVVGSIAALGLPAVAVQYHRLSIPLQLITKEQALRAGILPLIALAALVFSGYATLKLIETVRSETPKLPPNEKINAVGVLKFASSSLTKVGLTAEGAFFLSKKYVLGAVSYMFERYPGITPDVGGGMVILGAFVFVVVLVKILPKKLQRWLDSRYFPIPSNKAPSTNAWELASVTAGVFIRFCLLGGILVWEYNWFFLHFKQWRPQFQATYFDILLSAIVIGLGAASFVLLAEGSDRLLQATPESSADSSNRKRGLVAGSLGLLLLYGSFVTLYASDIYQAIPYAIGGGKPTPVTLWIDKKEVPEKIQGIISTLKSEADGDLIRYENIYLVHVDTEMVIISASNLYDSSSLVLPRHSIKALTTPPQ